jgi:hypothetical protein
MDEQLVQDDAKGVDVASSIQLVEPPRGLFGRHVGRCARDLAVHADGQA